MPSCISPEVPVRRRPSFSATRLWRATALGPGADIVLADRRGTGGSNPLLCQFYGPPEQPQTYFDAFLPIEEVRACRATHERTSDLSQCTTAASVEDLEAIRVALKCSQLTLVGGSCGTRLAMDASGNTVRASVQSCSKVR